MRPWCASLLAFCLISYGFLPLLALGQTTVSGSIHPNRIQIDSSANLHLQGSDSGVVDWVKNADANLDTPPTLIDGIAFGIKTSPPDQSGAPGGTGNWNGVRIVDGFGGGDQNIFTKGGKVNEPQSWEIAPGSIGSSKYDATQMYIANNQTDIFFGMERNGNNGTTAFDWEFNQKPPKVFVDDPNTDFDETTMNGYVPDRSDGDVMITFEMQGSGGSSGSVATFIFKFDGDDPDFANDPAPNVYVLCPAAGSNDPQSPCFGVNTGSVVASINGIAPTPGEPWGHVDGGSWVLEPGFSLRMFAEAKVSLSLLPGINICGGAGFVQVRTRASSTLSSDAKDTTKIFRYSFGGPKAVGELTSGCGLNIGYDATGSTNSAGGTSGLTYEWRFQRLGDCDSNPITPNDWCEVGGNSDPDATGPSGTFVAPSSGTYRALLKVTEATDCLDALTTNSVTVFPDVGGSALLIGDCDDTFRYSATGTGGSGRYSFNVKIYKIVNGADVLAHEFSRNSEAEDNAATLDINERTTIAGELDIDNFNVGGDGAYKALVTVSDFSDANCTFPAPTNTIQVRHPLTVSIAKSLASTNVNMMDANFSVDVLGTIGNAGSDTIVKTWEQFTGGAWSPVGGDSTTLNRTMAQIISAGTTGLEESASILDDLYKLRRTSLGLRLTATRSLNGQSCPITSNDLTVKVLKGVDP